jgi:hypothetical protein
MGKFERAVLTPSQESGTYLVLLQVGFTQLPQSLGVLVSSYLTFSPLFREMATTPISRNGILSVALSLSRLSGIVRVTDHPALWSSDFPPPSIPERNCHEERPSVPLRFSSFPEISEKVNKSLITPIRSDYTDIN